MADTAPPEESGFKPWDRALRDDDEEEEDILEPIMSSTRRTGEPMSAEEQYRARDLVAGKRYGRLRVALLGFLLLILAFFPLSATQGSLTFFWNHFDKGLFQPDVFTLVGGGILGLLLLAASIFASGLIRGFLQALFAGAFIGLLVGAAFEGMVASEAGTIELSGLFGDYQVLMMIAGFVFAVLGCRLKVYHPRKLLPLLLCIVGGLAIVCSLVLPPTLWGQEGVAFVQVFLDILKAPRLPVFWVVNLALFALMGLLAISSALPFKSGFRSRVALLFGFYLLLYPLVDMLTTAFKAGLDNLDMVALVSSTRMYMIGFFAVWALFVGLASFLGNLTVALNYNEHMLLSRS